LYSGMLTCVCIPPLFWFGSDILLNVTQTCLAAQGIKFVVIQSNSCTIHTLKHNHFNI
jgi:hypothetical protein